MASWRAFITATPCQHPTVTFDSTLLGLVKRWTATNPLLMTRARDRMTAARLRRNDAADILMTEATKNTYLPCGCNAPLLCYLPGNGALLAATSMLANLKAFPESWGVVAEGFPGTL